MRIRFPTIGGLCLGLAMILAAGCSSDESPTAPTPPNPTDVAQVVEQAGKLQPLGPDQDVVTDSQSHDEGAFRYITEVHDASKNIQEVTYLGLNDDVIWAGSLIKGATLHQFVYEPVVGVARSPVTLSINLEGSGTGTTLSETINDPKLSTIREGINALLGRSLEAGTSYAARAQFDKMQVYSESQLNLAVGADLKYGVGSLNTRFDWSSETHKNKIIAKYQQLYYSIDMDTPATPAAVFGSTNSLEGIKAAIPPGSCPVYVAGVTYGMMALTYIETDYAQSEMNAALDAAYGGQGLDVEIRTGLTKRQVLESSNIKTVVYGGSSAGLGQIETGYQGFIEVVHANIQLGTDSPGVPLIYKFRHLRDNTLADVTLTSQYSLTRMVRLLQQLRIVANRFFCEWADDDCGDDVLEITNLRVKANATQRATIDDPAVNYCLADTSVYDFSQGGYGHQMNDNDEHVMNTSIVFELDAEHFDYQLATIKLYAYVLDAEPSGFCVDDPPADASIIVPASEFGVNPHIITVYAPDYRMRCEVTIEMANKLAVPEEVAAR